jgi:hypothetical protein
VAAHVKATPSLAHIPVLLLAGAFEPVDEARAADAGCAGVLVKPFEPQLLIARVRKLLEARRPGPHAVGEPVATGLAGRTAISASPPAAMTPEDSAGSAAGPAPSAGDAASVDDYFERLDAAFASLDAHAESSSPDRASVGAAPPDAPLEAPAALPTDAVAADAALAGRLAPDAVAAGAIPERAGPLSMADAFSALLGVEQGAALPVLSDAWAPVVTDDLVEQVARRLADQVGERVVRELAPEIVTRVAERLVREEIARIRSEAEPGTH